jgi:outer membrane protein OmpA-like peptidoglycan-associated protein
MKHFISIITLALISIFLSACAPPTNEFTLANSTSSSKRMPYISGGTYMPNRCNCTPPGMSQMQSAPDSPTYGMVFTLDDVLFDYDKYTLKTRGIEVVQTVAHHMRQNPAYAAFIEGHTDSHGSAAYNMRLGLRRAEAVKTALMAQGIEAERITIRSYGKTRPRASNTTAQGRQLNRRVMISLM